MMWKIDISHSIIMIIYYAFQIVMEGITHAIPNLSYFTGPWFCYLSQFLTLYGKISITLHSLHTATHKYIFIIHYDGIKRFGKEKAKQISLWIYLAVPIFMAVSWMVRPHFEAISSVNRCLDANWTDRSKELNSTRPSSILDMGERMLLFCGLDDYQKQSTLDHFMHRFSL